MCMPNAWKLHVSIKVLLPTIQHCGKLSGILEVWGGGGGGGVCVGSGDELLFLFLQILVALAHASMFWDHTFVNVPLEDWEVAASTLTLAAMEHVAMQARTVSIV